ncbi:hypothetical protein TWF191_006195 [Orbilia oligospora]|uniref:Uncharacterized protein n=1 Tax=Orbilia oligospora TaxID=2813651 RepID=A0A7C8UVS0_ORBOL|nr:hypothetical protein TWF191_006195 [Orbilia oligospora]
MEGYHRIPTRRLPDEDPGSLTGNGQQPIKGSRTEQLAPPTRDRGTTSSYTLEDIEYE